MTLAYESVPDGASNEVASQLHAANMSVEPAAETEAQIQAMPAADTQVPIATKPTRRIQQIEGNYTDTDLVTLYTNEISQWGLLTKEGEVELNKLVLSGLAAKQSLKARNIPEAKRAELLSDVRAGQDASDEFIVSNLRLVISIAKKYQGSGVQLPDLVQNGNLGLMRAVEKFRADKGYKFSTYATWWIKQSIQRSIPLTAKTIKLPINAAEDLKGMQSARHQFALTNKRNPSTAELSQLIGFTEDKVTALQIYEMDMAEFSDPTSSRGDTNMTVGDTVSDPNSSHDFEETEVQVFREELVGRLLAACTDKQGDAMRLRFGFDGKGNKTLQEVADISGITLEAARRLIYRAVKAMRQTAVEENINLSDIFL